MQIKACENDKDALSSSEAASAVRARTHLGIIMVSRHL